VARGAGPAAAGPVPKEGAMDQLVDPAGRPGPSRDRDSNDESRSLDPAWAEDIESELCRSARETGWGCAGIVAFGPAPDDDGE
jgi:hypothetical protein